MASRVDVANTVSMSMELWAPLNLKPGDLQPDLRFAFNCLKGLIIEGIGREQCPLVPKWAAFVVAGAIIASRTGRFIVPPEPRPSDFSASLNRYLWQAVYEAIADGDGNQFLAAMAGFFIPIRHYPSPDPPYLESLFEDYWTHLPYEAFVSVGELSDRYFRDREKVFGEIRDQEVILEIIRVAQYAPTMIKIALGEMTDYRY